MSDRPRVYIGRLSSRAREREVERFFDGYGKIRDIMLKNGFGFVEFDDYRDADDAVHDLNGKALCGERVVLEIARGTPRGAGGLFVNEYNQPQTAMSGKYFKANGRNEGGGRPGYGGPQDGYKLIVENLSSRYDWQDLKDFMDKYGEVNHVDAHHYRRNEGVVEFARKKDMEYAIKKFDGTELNGRKIKLVPETSRYSRSPTPVRHHSRSSSRGKKSSKRSRSRSRSSRGSSSESGDGGRKRGRSRSSSSEDERPSNKVARKDDEGSPKKQRSVSPENNVDQKADHSNSSKSKSRSNSPEDGNFYKSRSGSPKARKSKSRSRSRSCS